MSGEKPAKSRPIPKNVRLSMQKLNRLSRRLRQMKACYPPGDPLLQSSIVEFKTSRALHKQLVRKINANNAKARDSSLMNSPASTYSLAAKRSSLGKLEKL